MSAEFGGFHSHVRVTSIRVLNWMGRSSIDHSCRMQGARALMQGPHCRSTASEDPMLDLILAWLGLACIYRQHTWAREDKQKMMNG